MRDEVRWRVLGRPAMAAAEYGGVWRAALVSFKERRVWRLDRPLGDALAWAVAGLLDGDGRVTLVPIPSKAATVRERGEDVTWRLARAASARLRAVGVDAVATRGLRHCRAVADQSGLDADAREANLAGSIAVRRGLRDVGSIVVVDDIATTGATLREAVRALASAGLDVRGAAVVAAATRRHGRDSRLGREHD